MRSNRCHSHKARHKRLIVRQAFLSGRTRCNRRLGLTSRTMVTSFGWKLTCCRLAATGRLHHRLRRTVWTSSLSFDDRDTSTLACRQHRRPDQNRRDPSCQHRRCQLSPHCEVSGICLEERSLDVNHCLTSSLDVCHESIPCYVMSDQLVG